MTRSSQVSLIFFLREFVFRQHRFLPDFLCVSGGSMSHQSPQGATRRTPTAPPDSSLSSSLQQQLSPGYPSNLSRSLVTSQRFPRLMHGIGTFGLGGRSGYDFDGTDASKTPSLLDMSEFPSLGNRGDGAMVTPNPTPIRHAYGMFNIIKQQVNMHGVSKTTFIFIL